MARQYQKQPKVTKNNKEQSQPSMKDVRFEWDTLIRGGFTDKVMASLGYAYTNNPYIQNQRVKRVSTQPFKIDRNNLEKALADVGNSEQQLRQASHSLYTNYSLFKLNSMYSNILTYRNYVYAKYVNSEDIKSKKYREELQEIIRWKDLLQPRRTFQAIVERAQWEGKVAYYIRDSKVENKKDFDYVYLQELPSDYIKITGWNSESKYTIMFDFTYFWQAGASPEQFPPIFKKYFEEMNIAIPENERNKPNPNNLSPTEQFYYLDNKWFYWVELPMDECFVFSQTESNPYQVPNAAGLFLQAKDLQDYTYLQQELLELPLNGVIMSSMPMAKDSNGTIATDNYGLGTEAFKFFTGMFNQAAPRGIRLFMSPATNPQFFKFDGDVVNNSQIVTNALQQFNSAAGVGGLNSTTDKPNISQVKTQQTLEAAYVEKMYPQFERCINTWLKNKVKTKYEWRFKMKGNVFKDTTDFSNTKELVALGQNYLMPELLSYYDLDIEDAKSLQEQVIQSEVYDKFQVVQSAYTQSKQTRVDTINENKSVSLKEGGRPSANLDEVESDGTASSIETGTNTAEGRETMSLKHCVECGAHLENNSKHYPFCSEDCKLANSDRLGGID